MNLIKIDVSGPVGSGKSEVMAVIDAALRAHYGIHTQVASYDLSVERNLTGCPIKAAKKSGQSAKADKTIFVISELTGK